MLVTTLLLALLGAAAAGEDSFTKKYAYSKVMTACFGEEGYYAYTKQMHQFAMECKEEFKKDHHHPDAANETQVPDVVKDPEIAVNEAPLASFFESLRGNVAGSGPQYIPVPVYISPSGQAVPFNPFAQSPSGQAMALNPFAQSPSGQAVPFNPFAQSPSGQAMALNPFAQSPSGQAVPFNPFAQSPSGQAMALNPFAQSPSGQTVPFNPFAQYQRQKREAMYSGELLQKMVKKVKAKVNILTCVLEKFGAMDENKNLKFEDMKLKYSKMRDVDAHLRADLIESIDKCKAFSMCLPGAHDSPLPVQLQQIMAFLMCDKKARVEACMKADLMKHVSEFDLTDFASDKDEDAKVEKLLHVLWGADPGTEPLDLLA